MTLLAVVLGSLLTVASPQETAFDRMAAEHEVAMHSAMLASASPRDWALESLRYGPGYTGDAEQTRARGLLLRKAAEGASDDRLVQWLWAAGHPACDQTAPCPERAGSLAVLEPDNAAAWLPVLAQAATAGDVAAVDAALLQMAAADTYNDRFAEASVAWHEVLLRHPAPEPLLELMASNQGHALTPAAREAMPVISAVAYAAAFALPSLQGLVNGCTPAKSPGATAARLADCGRIGRTMLNSGSSLLSRRLGYAVLRRSNNLEERDHSMARDLGWLAERAMGLSRTMDKQPEQMILWFDDLRSTGDEMEAMARQLQRAGIPASPPSGWQSPWQREGR